MKERVKNSTKYVSYHQVSGNARAAHSFVLDLHEAGIPVTWTPMVRRRKWQLGYEPHTGTVVRDPEPDALYNRPIPYDTVIVHTTPEYLPHWRKAEPNKHILHYTVWETDRLPRHWPPLLNTADEIIVSCQWNQQVFQQYGVTPRIHMIPHILDSLQNEDRMVFQELDPTLYIFYTSGKWIERKAICDLVWSHLWESKRRKDFSDFHAGMLTEDYIRNVDTTYNLLARPFLPVLTKCLPVSVLKRTHTDRNQGNRAIKSAGSISVIIPTFNRPHLLRQAVESVLAQSRPAKEIIIVDDGSEPACRIAIEGLSDLDCRIQLHYLSQNQGSGAARNAGLALAKGDYIVFLDDDDLLGENLLASSASRLDHCPDADIVVSRSCLFDTDSISIHQEVPASLIYFKEMETYPVEQILIHGLVIGSCMIRRSILNSVCFNEVLTFGEDLFFWLHLACQGCRFQGNPEAVIYVRQHSNDENARRNIYLSIVECYNQLLDSPLLRSRETRFVAHGRLALNLTRLGRATAFRHIAFLLICPDLIPQYLLKYLAIRFKIQRNKRILRRCENSTSSWSIWTI